MRKAFILVLALAMLMSLCAGCGGAANEPAANEPAANEPAANEPAANEPAANEPAANEPAAAESASGGHLTIGVQNDIGSMWPGGTPTSGKRTMRGLVYQTLFMQDENNEFRPMIAKSYEDLGNGTYSVTIFDYVYDSAGNHLTAEDVVFSYGLHIADGQEDLLASLVKYEATSDYTVEFTFDPVTLGQLQIAFELPVITKAAWEASGDDMATKPVGTGGYVLTDATMGSSYNFERVEQHWQTDEQYIHDANRYLLDSFSILVITDTSALAVALESGQIDYSPDIAAADLGNFSENGVAKDGYTLTVGADTAFPRIVYNCGENSPCQDINLRMAIAHAVDAVACAYTVHGPFGQVCDNATNPGILDAPAGYDDYFTYNVDLAKEYLEKSSYNGETLKMLVQPNKNVRPAATLIQQYCAEIGVTVELLDFEFAQYKVLQWESTGKEFDLHLEGVSSSDRYVFQSVVELDDHATPDDDINRIYINDPKLQALYDTVADPDTYSVEASTALLDYVKENCFLYGLYYGQRVGVGYDYVKGVRPSPSSGSPVYAAAYVEK